MIEFVAVCLALLLIVLPLVSRGEAPHTHVEDYVPLQTVDMVVVTSTNSVTVALTGVSATGSVGQPTTSTSVKLTGV